MTAPSAFDPHGDLDQLELTIPLHSLDVGLAMLLGGSAGVVALLATLTLAFVPGWFTIVVPPAMIALVTLVFVPRLSEQETLELQLSDRVVRLRQRPVGRDHDLPLETVRTVDWHAGLLRIEHANGLVEHWLDGSVAQHGPWLVQTLRMAVQRRRDALDGAAPRDLQALLDGR